MAQFPEFKFLFALLLNSNGGQFYKEISKFVFFKKVLKSQKKWSGRGKRNLEKFCDKNWKMTWLSKTMFLNF